MEDIRDEILTSLINCGYSDLSYIEEMERNFPGTAYLARDIAGDYGMPLNFGHFVIAVKRKAIEELGRDIPDQILNGLYEITIDDNYMDWGGIADYAPDLETDLQDLFVDYVYTGNEEVKDEFLDELNYVLGDD